MKRSLFIAIAAITLGTAALANDPAHIVTLRPGATIGDPRQLALRLANTYGGTLDEGSGDAIVIRVSPSRAALLARDPNVQSVTPAAEGHRPSTVAATAIDWNTGVGYEYDGSGNIKKIGTDTYSYDVVGRVVESYTGGVKRNYEYDAFGNRTKCTQGGAGCQDAEVISATSNQSSVATYDTRGNVVSQGGHTYEYDERNRLKSETFGAVTREYLYNAQGQRIAVLAVTSSGAWWRWTVRDPLSGKPLRDFTSQGVAGTAAWKWERDYVWRDGLLLATVQPDATGTSTTTYHYHLDHLGTPRRITDENDRIVGVHDYHPFGPEVPGGLNEPSSSRVKYTGHERDMLDSEVGGPSDYMMARYYSPTLGRFLSVDPALESVNPATPQSWNRYSYVLNNPIGAIDPDGRMTLVAPMSFRLGLGPLNPQGQKHAETSLKVGVAALAAYVAPSVGRAIFAWALGNPNQAKQVLDAALSPPGSSALPSAPAGKGEIPVGSLAGKCADCAKADLGAISGSTLVSGALGKGTHYAVETAEGVIVDRSIRDNLQAMGAKYDDVPADKIMFTRKEWKQLLERVPDNK